MVKKIGIFAGTFDPIHIGHLAFAYAAIEAGLEKVMFLPEPRPRRKQGVRALEHRTAMVRLATAQESRFSTIMLEQSRFTAHETLPLLRARFPGRKLVLMFGDDVIAHIAHWPHVDTLLSITELMIASRHEDAESLTARLKTLEHTSGLKLNYSIVHPAQEQVSSSVIRMKIKRGQDASELPEAVKAYIDSNRLYMPGAKSS